MVARDVEHGDRPVGEELDGRTAASDVACQHQHVSAVGRRNQLLAREPMGEQFEVKVGSELYAHHSQRV